MKEIFDAVNQVFDFVVPIADFLWGFPTNFDWYASIPILGNLSFAIVILIGSGIFFSIKTGFIQVTHFRKGLRILIDRKTAAVGITPLAAFFLSSAMRVGPGNIMGVTGAIAVGGPGALFWMWVSAFFGMATAFMEATLAQIFKERKGDELVGGLPFYGKKIMGNRAWVGVLLSCIFILYAMFCLPAQAFNVFSSVGSVAEIITGETFSRTSMLYCITGILLIGGTTFFAFGGIHKITAVTDKMVPVMAVIYCGTVLLIALLNIGTIPYFFGAVFGGAFTPEAVFGGFFGTALAQGVKRGLMSNEAGQGTITMSAAASDAAVTFKRAVDLGARDHRKHRAQNYKKIRHIIVIISHVCQNAHPSTSPSSTLQPSKKSCTFMRFLPSSWTSCRHSTPSPVWTKISFFVTLAILPGIE